MKICIVTGGSGGHIYPALTFADYVRLHTDHEVFFIGNDHKMESKIIPDAGYQFYAIHNKGLQGSRIDKIHAVFGQFKAIKEAKKHLKDLKPDLVFSFGGYVTLPVILAAKHLKIKSFLHEQNAFVGKANRMAARFVEAKFTCYEEAFKGESDVYMYGNPRASLANTSIDSSFELERIGINQSLPVVLYVMGSQGATTMNRIFSDALPLFKDKPYQVIFTTGPLEYDTFNIKESLDLENVFIEPFVDQKALLPAIDLIFARAGASTITEIAAFAIPSILVPSPYVANNHQYFNAKSLLDQGATLLVEEKSLTPETIVEIIDRLMRDDAKKEALSKQVALLNTPHVNTNILEVLEMKVLGNG